MFIEREKKIWLEKQAQADLRRAVGTTKTTGLAKHQQSLAKMCKSNLLNYYEFEEFEGIGRSAHIRTGNNCLGNLQQIIQMDINLIRTLLTHPATVLILSLI